MALEKKVGTGWNTGINYKGNFFFTDADLPLHQKLMESWGFSSDEASSGNRLIFNSTGAYTTNKGGVGTYYQINRTHVDGIIRSIEKNNFELAAAVERRKIGSYNQVGTGIIKIVTNAGIVTGTFGSAGVKWSSNDTSDMTDVSSLDAWQEEVYSTWHIKCVIADSTITTGNKSLFILSTGKAQTVEDVIEYNDVDEINEIKLSGNATVSAMKIDDLTIWEDTSDANAKTDIDGIAAGATGFSLQPHIRYIAPMADQTAYTTNGTIDDWTANSVDNETDLTDGDDSTFSEMTDKEGGLITTATDLSGTVAAAGYTVNEVKSLAAAGFKVEDNEDNTFVGTLNSDGTGGGTTKTAVVAQGASTPAYIRFDEADLTTEGITKTTKAATTFKLQ